MNMHERSTNYSLIHETCDLFSFSATSGESITACVANDLSNEKIKTGHMPCELGCKL